MNTLKAVHERTRRLTVLALLSALVVVLTMVCTVIKFGPFSITLALTPIILGAALYGPSAGALLGFVFSLVVYVTGLFSWDGGFILLMMNYSAVGTTFICLFKGTMAGLVAGLVFKLLNKHSPFAATVTASVTAPIVNTGLFALAMMSIFYGFLSGNATDGQSPIGMLFLSWIGINFIVEFVTNVALSGVLLRVIDYYRKKNGKNA